MASAICKFTTHTRQVYIVTPSISLPAVLPSLSKAWISIAFVQKKKIIMALINPFSIQLSIRRQLKRTFCTPSWYNKGNCHIKNKYDGMIIIEAINRNHIYNNSMLTVLYFRYNQGGFTYAVIKKWQLFNILPLLLYRYKSTKIQV